MDQKQKIKNILEAIKFDVTDINRFEKDIDSILGMFNEINEVDVSGVSSTLNRKKVRLSDLREDASKDWGFRKDVRGKYFNVPNVSKK
jgi:aspartyl/glutamyl-tRNA(Asn/Gln) amidotransferase C subunit